MAKETITLDQLEEILLRATSVVDPGDVPTLMWAIRQEAPKEHYELLHVQGFVEPFLVGEAKTWEEFETKIVEFLEEEGEYNPDEDGLFFIRLDPDGKLKGVCSFSNVFMDKMKERADGKAKATS